MADVDKVEELLQTLDTALDALRAIQAQGIPDLAADPIGWGGARYMAQVAIQACVDTADQMLASLGLEEPARSRDVFPALAGAGLLDAPLAHRLARLVGYRNALVHNYLSVTSPQLESRLPEIIEATAGFSDAAARWLRSP